MDTPTAPQHSPELVTLLETLELKITQERASFAERAFGLGCNTLTIPMLLILAVFYLFGVRSWVGLAFILIVEGIAGFILAALFSTQSQMAASKRFFEQTALPEIQEFAAQNNLTIAEIAQAAAGILPQEAFLTRLIKNSGAPQHERPTS